MDEFTKEQLVAQFRTYLDDAPGLPVTSPAPDLFSLFTELAGLRNEVKLESRQVKSALDQFRSVFELLQTSQASLGQERAQYQAVQQQQHQGEIRNLLLEFIDLHDRLEAGSRASIYVPPTGFRFCRCLEHVNLIQSIHEGQAITLRRLIDMLARHQVYPLTVVNQVFDPYCMKAAAVDNLPDVEHGIVTEELRKGFMWGEDVLRLAEVKVNKKQIVNKLVNDEGDFQ